MIKISNLFACAAKEGDDLDDKAKLKAALNALDTVLDEKTEIENKYRTLKLKCLSATKELKSLKEERNLLCSSPKRMNVDFNLSSDLSTPEKNTKADLTAYDLCNQIPSPPLKSSTLISNPSTNQNSPKSSKISSKTHQNINGLYEDETNKIGVLQKALEELADRRNDVSNYQIQINNAIEIAQSRQSKIIELELKCDQYLKKIELLESLELLSPSSSVGTTTSKFETEKDIQITALQQQVRELTEIQKRLQNQIAKLEHRLHMKNNHMEPKKETEDIIDYHQDHIVLLESKVRLDKTS